MDGLDTWVQPMGLKHGLTHGFDPWVLPMGSAHGFDLWVHPWVWPVVRPMGLPMGLTHGFDQWFDINKSIETNNISNRPTQNLLLGIQKFDLNL